jgi:hypothetical protein
MRYLFALGAAVVGMTACGGVSHIGDGKDESKSHGDASAGGSSSNGGAPGKGGATGTANATGSGGAGNHGGSAGAEGGAAASGTAGTHVGGSGNASGGGCKSALECAVPEVCKLCPNGESSCATAECVAGQCQTSFPPCGDAGAGSVCGANRPCPATTAPCKVCPDGTYSSCPGTVCMNGQCVITFTECPPVTGLKWFQGCGAPVCRVPDVPTGAPLCDPAKGQKVGGSCTPEGATCDPGGSCQGNLICATKDPRSPAGCPISRAKYKQDIEYLSDGERAKLASDLQSIPLVRYRYKDGPEREHLGFIIEDVEPSPSVDSRRDQVDLYGYTSMAVAALQQQHAEIETLKAEIRSLKTELAKSKKTANPGK